MSALDKKIMAEVDRIFPELVRISRTIHDSPEIGFQEKKASHLLKEFLVQQGFQVEPETPSLPTAFRAYQGSSDIPAVAFLSEYDALPKLGHACGHNLIAVASAAAGVALASVLPNGSGRVFVIGTPGEEMYGGKIRMIEEGLFQRVDAAMMFHPSVRNAVVKRTLSMTEIKIAFFGKSTHAAASPELGINALDAMILFFSSINALRQQIPEDARIHGIITQGGDAPNIIPSYTAARVAIRSLDVKVMRNLVDRVNDCVQGAAQAAGCTFEVENAGPVYEGLIPNYTLADVFEQKVESLGITIDDRDETKYIGSSDIGNLSQIMPALHPELAISTFEHIPHTTGFAEASRSATGEKVMAIAAKALAMTGLEVLINGDMRKKMTDEFEKSRQKTDDGR